MPDYLDVAIQAARAAGERQRRGRHEPLTVRAATLHDIKLAMDVECEELIRELLLSAFPDHALLGEEGGGSIEPGRPTWIVDPLDGTVNYARRIPHFCTSIALRIGDRTEVGVIYDPVRDELFACRAGGGATLNGAPIAVSAIATLDEAIMAVGLARSSRAIDHGTREIRELAWTARKIRMMGAAALDLAYVAAGRYDGFVEYGLQLWDIAAGVLLIQEAGGMVGLNFCDEHGWDVRAHNGHLW